MPTTEKLYVVTRKDLSFGQRAIQVSHALADFSLTYREAFEAWHDRSNTLVLLEVTTEQDLTVLSQKVDSLKIRHVPFREEDLQEALISIAFHPEAQALLRGLPLAFT